MVRLDWAAGWPAGAPVEMGIVCPEDVQMRRTTEIHRFMEQLIERRMEKNNARILNVDTEQIENVNTN